MKLFKNIFRNRKREIAEQIKVPTISIRKISPPERDVRRTFELKKKSLADLRKA